MTHYIVSRQNDDPDNQLSGKDIYVVGSVEASTTVEAAAAANKLFRYFEGTHLTIKPECNSSPLQVKIAEDIMRGMRRQPAESFAWRCKLCKDQGVTGEIVSDEAWCTCEVAVTIRAECAKPGVPPRSVPNYTRFKLGDESGPFVLRKNPLHHNYPPKDKD